MTDVQQMQIPGMTGQQVVPQVPGQQQAAPQVPGQQQVTPQVPGQQQVAPQVPGQQQVTPQVPGQQQVTPQVPGQQQVTPQVPGQQQAAPQSQQVTTGNEIDYSIMNIDPNKIVVEEPKPGSANTENGPMTFHKAGIKYNYGTTDQPDIAALYFELPKVIMNGIYSNEKEYTKKDEKTGEVTVEKVIESTAKISFDTKNSEHIQAMNQMREILRGFINFLDTNMLWKQKLGLHQVTAANFDAVISFAMKPMVIEKPGQDPYKYYKLNGNANRNYHTRFINPLDGSEIPWDLIKDKRVELVPMIQVTNCFANENIHCMQTRLVSAIVLDIKERAVTDRQKTTMIQIQQKYQGQINSLQEQLASLQAAVDESQTAVAAAKVGQPEQKPTLQANMAQMAALANGGET